MNLENRVEVLEHELKILKNEIEGTLLEIQSQVLIHYYPDLRAEDLTPPQDVVLAATARTMNQKSGFSEAAPAQLPSRSNGITNMQMKEVSLREFAQDALPPAMAADEAGTQLGPVALAHLAKWVDYAIAQVGKAQTTAVVEAYADASSDAIQAALHQFIELSTEEGEPTIVDTTALMQVSRKLNKVFDQVAKLTTQIADRYPVDRYPGE